MLRRHSSQRAASPASRGAAVRAGALGLMAILAVSCSEDPTTPPGEPRVSQVVFEPSSLQIFEGEPRDLSGMVTLLAADGTVLEDREVEWASTDASVVSVDADGNAMGEGAGTATVTATSEEVTGELAVEVEEAPELRIDSVEPDSLEDGGSATLRGEGFQVSDLEITVAGARASIVEAGEESVEVELSSICRPRGDVEVRAAILQGRISDEVAHPYVGGEPLEMDPGEFRYLSEPEDFCLLFEEELSDEEYAFGVQSTSDAGTLTPVRVSAGASEDGTLVALAADATSADRERVAPPSSTASGSQLVRDPSARALWREHHRAEAALRQRDRRMFEELAAAPRPSVLAADGWVAAQEENGGSIPEDVSQGDTVDIRVPDLDEDNFCQEFVSITTVAEVVGDRGVFLVDVDNPDDGFDRDDWEQLSERFDEHVHPALEEHFGEATDLDGTGRIAMVSTEVVNDFEEAPLGFVTSCDFFPRESAASSDYGEIFYGRAPVEGTNFGPQRAREDFPRLIAHEVTHLIQFGRRIEAGHDQMTIWELEGQAVLGEEVAGHRSWGHGAREDLGVGEVGIEEDDYGTEWYTNGFIDLFLYFGLGVDGQDLVRVDEAPEECSWLEQRIEDAPCDLEPREPYGVSWTFLRWVADHFHDELPDGEATFHQEIIDSGDAGFSNVEGIVGESWQGLLAEWAATLYADNQFEGDHDPRIDFPSWDLSEIEDIRAGQNGTEVGLQPRERDFDSFEDDFQVRGGSNAYYVISGSNRPATGVRAGTLEGDLLPPAMQMWVVRVR